MLKYDIMIGVPCHDNKLYIETASAITATIVELLRNKSNASLFAFTGCSVLTHARNAIVAKFLSQKEKTHLLFVDSDMDWTPHTVARMLKANMPFVAATYAKKKYNNILASTYRPKDLDSFHAIALDWNVEFEDAGVITGEKKLTGVLDGFAKVKRVGAGLMLLRRDMLETMVSKYPETEYLWDGPAGDGQSPGTRYFGLFDFLKNDRGFLVGEDYSFCDRWIEGCGGEIWCDVDAKIGHHGHHRYSSSIQESLRLRSRATS